MQSKELLLLSNSRNPDSSYLAHALEAIQSVADRRRLVAFLPFAAVSVEWDAYTAAVKTALEPLGLEIMPLHRSGDPIRSVLEAELIMVGGGNTFQLLKECRARDLLAPVAKQVRNGVPYLGWSAGSNLACPTICTTNDMPIVHPGSFEALDLIGFQINPHYTDVVAPGYQGETRAERIQEFLLANPQAQVLGLPEGDWLQISGSAMNLAGPLPATLFLPGGISRKIEPGSIPFDTEQAKLGP